MSPSSVSAAVEALGNLEFPTLGHSLEDGFAGTAIRCFTPGLRLIGRARTVRLDTPDAGTINRALCTLEPGDVLVVQSLSPKHACIGAITRAAARARGAVGIVVDGAVTDIDVIAHADPFGPALALYARGTTSLTTKRDAGAGGLGVAVRIGATVVHEGDLVLGDDNGLLFIRTQPGEAYPGAAILAPVLPAAAASDAGEPTLLARIATGVPLTELLYTAS